MEERVGPWIGLWGKNFNKNHQKQLVRRRLKKRRGEIDLLAGI
jgi:hypothetical protein